MATSSIPPEQLAKLAQEDQGPKIVGVVVAFTAIALLSVTLRFFTRLRFTGFLGWEDYCIAVSMVFSIAMAVCQVEQVQYGTGKHSMFLTIDQATGGLRYLFFSVLAYCISLTLTKISILLQYRRIFSLKQARIPIYIVMAICAAYGVEAVFTGTFTCIPVDAFWNLMKKPTAKCINENALYYANAAINVATDLLIAALPVKAIWALQIEKKQKIALLVILTLGWFVCITSILRLNALHGLAIHPLDPTWYGGPTAYWSAIEVNLAIVCASTPALKPLVVRIVPAFSSRRGTRGTGDSSDQSRGSNRRSSFMRLKGKLSNSSTDENELESGLHRNITTLPTVHSGNPSPVPGQIRVTQKVEQCSECGVRVSESESQRSLFPESPKVGKF